MDPINVLQNPRATKKELRDALAKALGVEVPPDEPGNTESLFNSCRERFCLAYRQHTGLAYRFGAREGAALASVIRQIRDLGAMDDKDVLGGFAYLIDHLPQWYRDNQFNLPVIDRKFNDIVISIKKSRNGRSENNGGVSRSYRERVLGDLLS